MTLSAMFYYSNMIIFCSTPAGDVYGDDIMKLNKKGRKRAPVRQNSNLGMGIELTETATPKTNSSSNTSSSGGPYKSKYAQPVVSSYKS